MEQINELPDPRLFVVRKAFRTLRVAEPDHVGGNNPKLLGQFGYDEAPVGPRRHARTGAMNEDYGRPDPDIMDVGGEASGLKRTRDFRRRHSFPSETSRTIFS